MNSPPFFAEVITIVPDPPGCGVAFELSPPSGGRGAWTETVLYEFTDESGGAVPSAAGFDSEGNFYGAAVAGGSTPDCTFQGYTIGCGVVFELSPPKGGSGSWTEAVLYSFLGGSDGGIPGQVDFGPKGKLYGGTMLGGKAADCTANTPPGCGVVFELSPPSGSDPWTETVLHAFTGGSDGASSNLGPPNSDLLFNSAGDIYGVAIYGGNTSSNCMLDTRQAVARFSSYSRVPALP
jgi:hypothetical protein